MRPVLQDLFSHPQAPADALRADEEELSERIGSLNGLFAKAIAELTDAGLQAVNGGGGPSGGVIDRSRDSDFRG